MPKNNSRVSLLLPKKFQDEISDLAAASGDDRSTLMRKLMQKGLEDLKLDSGIDHYVKGKTSLEKSAQIAGVSLWRFLEELGNRKIGLRYKLEDAREEISRIASRYEKR